MSHMLTHNCAITWRLLNLLQIILIFCATACPFFCGKGLSPYTLCIPLSLSTWLLYIRYANLTFVKCINDKASLYRILMKWYIAIYNMSDTNPNLAADVSEGQDISSAIYNCLWEPKLVYMCKINTLKNSVTLCQLNNCSVAFVCSFNVCRFGSINEWLIKISEEFPNQVQTHNYKYVFVIIANKSLRLHIYLRFWYKSRRSDCVAAVLFLIWDSFNSNPAFDIVTAVVMWYKTVNCLNLLIHC